MTCLILIIKFKRNNMKKNLILIFGGKSCEHDISIISAMQVIKNLDEYLYNVFPIYVTKEGKFCWIKNFKNLNLSNDKIPTNKIVALVPGTDSYLFKKTFNSFKKWIKVDVAVLVMHGKNGEDGTMASLMNLCQIPYTSSDMTSSALCLDKCLFKSFLKNCDLPVIDGISVDEQDFFTNTQNVLDTVEKTISFPCIIKPANLGSSIGIKVCNKRHDLANYIEFALKFDKKVLIEEYLTEIKEINVAVFKENDQLIVSNFEQPISSDAILSFNNKYLQQGEKGGDFLRKKTQPKLPKKLLNELSDTAKTCYKKCGFKGVVRFDFILDKNNNFYINEANSIPGSYANYLFVEKGINFKTLLNKLIDQAIVDFEKEKHYVDVFESSVLNCVNFSKFNK